MASAFVEGEPIVSVEGRRSDVPQFDNDVVIFFAYGLDDGIDEGEADFIGAGSGLVLIFFSFFEVGFEGEGAERGVVLGFGLLHFILEYNVIKL